RRERLDVAPLPLRVERVERKRRLPRTRDSGQDYERVSRNIEIQVLQVMLARAADANQVHAAIPPSGRRRIRCMNARHREVSGRSIRSRAKPASTRTPASRKTAR